MYEIRPGGFNSIPPIIKNLVIVNVLVYIAQITFQNNEGFRLENLFALHDVRSVYFRPHQLVTYMFMHGSWMHLFMNMFAMWVFGSTLERTWGPKRFLTFCVVSGLGAALIQMFVVYLTLTPVWEEFYRLPLEMQQQLLYNTSPRNPINTYTVGASGIVFGCLAAFGYLFPNTPLYLYFLFPIKAKWLVLGYAAIELWSGLQNAPGDGVAHWAHLGGALVGFLLVWFWNKSNRRTFY